MAWWRSGFSGDDSPVNFTIQLCGECLANRGPASVVEEPAPELAYEGPARNLLSSDEVKALIQSTYSTPGTVYQTSAPAPDRPITTQDAPAYAGPVGPEAGEILPKTFTDGIRIRVAAQWLAGASIERLAAAWGRSTASIRVIVSKFPNGC